MTYLKVAAVVVVACALQLAISCAIVKPIPQQALNCAESAAPGAAMAAGVAIATHETEAQIEMAAEGVALGVLECTALAIWGDVEHAVTVSARTGVPVPTIQANAAAYLQAKGLTVTAP